MLPNVSLISTYKSVYDRADTIPAIGRRRLISQPFDFLHVKHTHQNQLTELHRLSQHELMTEFAAATNGQQPSKELNGIEANDLLNDGYTSDVPQSNSKKHLLAEQARKHVPPRPKRSDELLADTAAAHADSPIGIRHVRSAETIEQIPAINLSQITPGPAPSLPHQSSRRNWADGPTVKNLGGLGARQPTGAPQSPPSGASEAPQDPRWSVFAANGFTNPSASSLPAGQVEDTVSAFQALAIQPYGDDPLLSPSYGKELERVPEEPEESRSQRASKIVPKTEEAPASPSAERPSLPKRWSSRSKQSLSGEPIRRPLPSRQPLSRGNSNASDTLGGFIHRPLTARKSTSSLRSTATGRSRVTKRGADSGNWEDEIDFAYEHHMEAHCDLDWNNVKKRETSGSVETVPELDHSASSSARSTQDGSLVTPSTMGIGILATVKEALSSPDVSSGEEPFRRRKPHVRDLSRESFLYDDGRPDLGLLPTPSDLDDPTMTMSATTLNSSEVATPASAGGVFSFPVPKLATDSLPSSPKSYTEGESPSSDYNQDMYDDVLASYEEATRPSLDAVIDASNADKPPPIPRRHDSLNIAESRKFQRPSLLLPLPKQPAKHQKSASTGTVTDFAVATLRARLQKVSQPEDDGVTPRQSSRLSANNLKLHTMVSQLRDETNSPTTPMSEDTEDPASLCSSQASLPQQEGLPSMAPSSTASDDIFESILPPASLKAPPIPQRSRSRLGRPSLLSTPSNTSESQSQTAPTHRTLHSASPITHHTSPPTSPGAQFSTRSSSLGAISPITTVASGERITPASPIEDKELPPLPSPEPTQTGGIFRRNSNRGPAIGMATLAAPNSVRPASKGSVMTTIHSPTELAQSKPTLVKIEKPTHKRTSSRTSIPAVKYRQIRHWNYDFGAVDPSAEPEMPPAPAPKKSSDKTRTIVDARPITQFNLSSQEILSMGSEMHGARAPANELVARQYSDMASDQPPPTFVTTTPARNAGFSLFPVPRSKVRNMAEAKRLDRVLTALQ